MTSSDPASSMPRDSWLDQPLKKIIPQWTVETVLITAILVLAVISRFHDVGLRVMSHDEVNHVVPSFDLYQGRGYRHDPVTHGPLQFHLIALSFFLLGDNDFSARVPAAVFSVAAVAFVLFGFRRYLGRHGAILAGLFFLISPFMLFYGRYTRNEGIIELLGVTMLYAVLRYLDKGDRISLYLLTLSLVLHFTAKETAYIYSAQLLLFLGLYFLVRMVRREWQNRRQREVFLSVMLAALIFLLLALGLAIWKSSVKPVAIATPVVQATESAGSSAAGAVDPLQVGQWVSLGLALFAGLAGIFTLIRNQGWQVIRSERSFDLLMLTGTLVLPQLSAFPVKLVGWDPLDYSTTGATHTAIFVVIFFVVSILLGLWWKSTIWLTNAAIFYSIFLALYTTFFTNGLGFFTGLVGSLGYWLSQQGVQRGSQPWYYFMLVQMPVYEFLGICGSVLAVYYGFKKKLFSSFPGMQLTQKYPAEETSDVGELPSPESPIRLPILSLLLFWSVTSLVAYSVAGEKMPWLTVHIAWPFLLTAAWGLGCLVETTPWRKILGSKSLIGTALIPIFLLSLAAVLGSLLGNQPPFQGKTIEQLQTTSTFLLSMMVVIASGAGIIYLLRHWSGCEIARLCTVFLFILIGILTARTAYRAAFINYDYATEYLVYAHAAPGPKLVMNEVEDISRRLTGGTDIQVAYDNDCLYPYWWYLRNYPNHRWYTDKPTRDLAEFPLIIAGDATMSKMEPIVKDKFVSFDYVRLWWPNQSYFNLTWERISSALTDPRMRSALFQVWLNRDYRPLAELSGDNTYKVETWQPSSRMRFYIRKDIAAKIWNYGILPETVSESAEADPYEGNILSLPADLRIGMSGSGEGQLNAPRDIAFGPDGTLYIADSRNHRIQHFSSSGDYLGSWGSFADVNAGAAPGGTFNEPWGIATGGDGSVYVADTWNHRIQKFSSDGKFLAMWGYFGQGENPEAFWGPRDVEINPEGQVLVSDTGNKRVVIFNANGEYLAQFGNAGVEAGQFDEPVGLVAGVNGDIYVADTWNQRIQVFSYDPSTDHYLASRQWDIYGWFGQSLENKPYLAWMRDDHILTTDPEGYRILEFASDGTFTRGFSDWLGASDISSLTSGITVDNDGLVWLSDAGSNTVLRLPLPSR